MEMVADERKKRTGTEETGIILLGWGKLVRGGSVCPGRIECTKVILDNGEGVEMSENDMEERHGLLL